MLADKLATLHQLALADGQIVKTGALLIVPATNQVMTKDGQVATGLFSCGIPTEGIHWLTAAAARPGVDPGICAIWIGLLPLFLIVKKNSQFLW